jgi:hypothetical protein
MLDRNSFRAKTLSQSLPRARAGRASSCERSVGYETRYEYLIDDRDCIF